jgi:hypothetical protein
LLRWNIDELLLGLALNHDPLDFCPPKAGISGMTHGTPPKIQNILCTDVMLQVEDSKP